MNNKKILKSICNLLLILMLLTLSISAFPIRSYSVKDRTISYMPDEYKSLFGKVKEDYNLVITTRDGEVVEKLLPNAKYVIKEIWSENEMKTKIMDYYEEFDPVDAYGLPIGTEEMIDGKICRTFTSDENGEIKLSLWEGKYKITQVDTDEGYFLNEENTYIVTVNQVRGAIEDIEIENPVFTQSNYVQSVSTDYVVEGRNDGYALYFYKDYYKGGQLSLLNNYNEIVDTINSDEVYKIIPVENGWYVLAEDWITKESYVIYYSDYDDILERDWDFKILLPNGFKTFDIDNDGNFILVGETYNEENESYDLDLVVVDSTGMNILEERTFGGNEDEFINSIVVTNDAYYLSVYLNSESIIINNEEINVKDPYCILKIEKEDFLLEKIQVLPTYTEAASQDKFRRVHTIKKGNDETLYYIGSFEGEITFDAELTQIGEKITLKSKGEEDGIVIKLDKDLLIEWVTDIGGEGNDHFYDAGITEDGGIIIGGDSDYGYIWFAPPDTQSKEGIYTYDVFGDAYKWRGVALKLNQDGEAVWAYEFGYTENEGMYGIAVLSNDTFALCGFESPNGTTEGTAAIIRLNEYEIAPAQKEVAKLDVSNRRKEFEIETSTTENGSISGQYDDVYEKIKFGDTSSKEIVVKPNKGYKIKFIRINGQTIEFEAAEDYSYKFKNFENVKNDISIDVEYELDPTQTKDLSYTIEYYKDGIKQENDTEVIKKSVHVLDETTKTLQLDKSKINVTDKYEDYFCEKTNPKILPEEVNNGDVIKVFYKSKVTKVLINHIDINTKKVLEKEEKNVKIGDLYNGAAKDIENYALVERPEKETITIIDGENILNYYYAHKSEGVIEKHIDFITGELLDNIVYKGNEGDDYKTKSLEMEGYDLVDKKLPENSEGKMKVEVTEVKYYYIKKATVRVQYLNKENNGKIFEDIVIKGHEGDEYTTDLKDFADYDYIENSNNTSGKMVVKVGKDGKKESEIIVKYYYKKISKQPIYNTTNNTTNNITNNTIYNITNNAPNGELQPITYVISDSNKTTTSTSSVGKTDYSASNNSSNYLPKTGDMKVVIASVTIMLIICANVIQIILSKKKK